MAVVSIDVAFCLTYVGLFRNPPSLLLGAILGFFFLWWIVVFLASLMLVRDKPHGIRNIEVFFRFLYGPLQHDIREYDPGK